MHVIGLLISSFPGVQHGPLYYRSLEYDKIITLQENRGSLEAKMFISAGRKCELAWRADNICSASKCISQEVMFPQMAGGGSH